MELMNYVNVKYIGHASAHCVVTALLALLLKLLYPILPPKSVDDLVNQTDLQFTKEEASVLYYTKILPSYDKWMSTYDSIFGHDKESFEEAFASYFSFAEENIKSRVRKQRPRKLHSNMFS
jgi:hypothetical protein